LPRPDRLGWGLLAAGAAAGVLLVVAELSTVSYVSVVTASCEDLADPRLADRCLQTGHERHGWAFVLIAVLVVLMAWGAAAGRSRPAAVALIAAGAAVLVISIARDLPETSKTGVIGEAYEAKAHAGKGLWLELAGGALAVAVGAGGLARGRRRT
jgi:hypothetical protein